MPDVVAFFFFIYFLKIDRRVYVTANDTRPKKRRETKSKKNKSARPTTKETVTVC